MDMRSEKRIIVTEQDDRHTEQARGVVLEGFITESLTNDCKTYELNDQAHARDGKRYFLGTKS